jgi:dipeptidyl aminopeptidase/acylaminoacyl peptidase
MPFRYLLLMLLLVSASFLQSASQSIDDYLSAPFPTSLVASPDGKAIAWVFNKKGERNIYYAQAPDYKQVPLTAYKGDEGVEISQLAFTPDGKHIVYVRGNGSNGQGEPANPAQLQTTTERKIFRVTVAGGESVLIARGSAPLVSPDGKHLVYLNAGKAWMTSLLDTTKKPAQLFMARGGVGQMQWSPDGKWLAFVSNRGDHSFVGLFDVAAKEVKFVETSLDFDAFPVWSPDGKKLAYLRVPNINNLLPFTAIKRSNPWSIRVLDIASMKAAEVFKADTGIGSVMVDDLPAVDKRLWWTRNNQLVFPWEKNGWMQLYAVDLAGKKVQHLTPGQGEVEGVSVNYTNTGLYYTTNIGGIDRRYIWFLDFADLRITQQTRGETISWGAVGIENGFACLQSTDKMPAWPVISQYGKPASHIASDLFPGNFPLNSAAPQPVDLVAADGFRSHAQLVLPKQMEKGKKHPAVIFLHGGSRRQMLLGFNYGQYYSNAYALQQYFASKGYVALTLNYRSGIGYGIHFREADNYGAGGASEVKDLMAAAAYLANRSDVDASQVSLWGGSYGGYLTAHGLSQAPDRFLCGVDIHGVHNWNNDIPVFAPWYKAEKFPDMAKLAFQSSPMNYVKQWKRPVMLIHGDDDRNVLFSESVELAEVLRKQGVHVEQLVFPDEVHSFLLYRNWVKAYEATFEFIDRHVKAKK